MSRRILFMVLLMVVFASTVHAQLVRAPLPTRTDNWEFTMLTRYVASQTVEGGGGSSLLLQDDLGWGFGFAYNFNQHFNLGMEFSWRSTNYTASIPNLDEPGVVEHYSSRMDVSSWVVSANYHLLEGSITPYVSGSFGWSLIDSNIFAGFGTGCYWDPWYGQICGPYPTTFGTDTTTGNLGLGLRAELTPKFFVRGSYEYNWLGLDNVDGEHMGRADIGFLF